ncbi:discoidin domain-containing protein [Actinopolymorpha sp. B17G11]|uniref:discoidin domain-containing protein n=1 Tax=Actinopolymorpha sp. B17G11 TaxID=3160861 RepID=UPI0032E4CF98
MPVTVTTPPTGHGANLALAATVTASSTHASFSVCGAIDGNSNQDDWEVSTGWNDGSPAVFPDWLAVEFAQPEQVSRVVVHTLDSSRIPGSGYGLRDWDVQVPANDTWLTVAAVRGNTVAPVVSSFATVTTAAVRILALASNDARYSRIVEFEVHA